MRSVCIGQVRQSEKLLVIGLRLPKSEPIGQEILCQVKHKLAVDHSYALQVCWAKSSSLCVEP